MVRCANCKKDHEFADELEKNSTPGPVETADPDHVIGS